jgi:hypothetical protein
MALDFGSTIDLKQSGTSQLIGTASGFRKPYQPAFMARHSSATAPGNYVAFNDVIYNIGSHYNNSTYLFTAPVAGVYLFHATFLTENAMAGEYRMAITHNGNILVNGQMYIMVRPATGGYYTMRCSGHFQMAVNDTMGCYYISGPGNTHANPDYNCFSGYLI